MLVEHDVCGFQIAVQHASFVYGCETRAELARNVDRFVLGQTSDAFEQ
jgi:hypothetical protein